MEAQHAGLLHTGASTAPALLPQRAGPPLRPVTSHTTALAGGASHPRLAPAAQSVQVVRDRTAAVNSAVRQRTQRPAALLVFLNPFGGARQARWVWQRMVVLIFDLARCAKKLTVFSA